MIRLLVLLMLLFAAAPAATQPLQLGIDILLAERSEELAGKRIGLVTNAAAVDAQYRGTIDRLASAPGVQLVALFGPEHGVRGDAQAGVHVGDAHDAATGLPVYS
ncbi:MAG: exo-beta-N-acetylmuramidase NamZ domain-containing protein, partial [Sphingopyxis sp.]